jgi:hypothetical protein
LVWAASRKPKLPKLITSTPKQVLERNVDLFVRFDSTLVSDLMSLPNCLEMAVNASIDQLCRAELKHVSLPIPELTSSDLIDLHWNNSLTLSKLKNVLNCCNVDSTRWTKLVQM